jgi:hypothetical protein
MRKIFLLIIPFLAFFFLINLSTIPISASQFDLGDKTSNGNDLTNHGATEWTTDFPFSTSTEAINLSAASSQYLSTSDNSAWKPTPNMTVEFWAKFTSLPGSNNYPAIVSNLSASNGLGWDVFYDGDTGKLRFYIQTLGSSINVTSNTSLSTGSWHHYAITFDGTTVKFYLDGAADGSVTAPITLSYESGQHPLIGALYLGGTVTRFIDAKVDDVRIWNVARTSAAITNDKDRELTSTEDGLAAYYPFETILPQNIDLGDKTTNGNDLTNHGVTEWASDFPFSTSTKAVNLSAASSQYLSVADNAAWKPTPNMTVEFWAKFTNLPGSGNYPAIVSNLSSTNSLGWDVFYDGDTGKLRFYIQTLGSSINVSSNTALSTGSWHHYAITFDGTTVKFYLDGAADGSVTAPITLAYESGQHPLIGALFFGDIVDRFIDAKVDDVRIWNVTRTGTQVNDNKDFELAGTESGLAAYYPFETLLQSKITYFTKNDGTNFSRSTAPISSGVATQTNNSDGSVTMNINSATGYTDSGFVLYEGTLGDLPNFTVTGTGDQYGLNLWFDTSNDNEYFAWDGSNILTGLNGDTYALGPNSSSGVDAISGSSQFYLMSDGQNHSLSDLKSGSVSGISSSTKVAVWIGNNTSSGSKSSTIDSVNGL